LAGKGLEMNFTLEMLVDDAIFAESPRWHDGALWYSDIGAGHICRVTNPGKKEIVLDGLANPSGLGWTQSGDMLVASLDTAEIYRIGPDKVRRVLCGPERHKAVGTNDMATMRSRSYVTCSGYRYEIGNTSTIHTGAIGKILMVEHETGECRTVASDLRMPNGVAITPDGKTLIVAELFASRILKFDITADGTLTNQRLFAGLNSMPDGLTLDAEGAVWVGTGGSFQHVDAKGEVLHAIEVPGWTCIACMLGGLDGRSLFMVVSHHNHPDEIFTGKAKSRLLRTRVDVPVAPTPAP
jgi:sugar lactone lactonase YvrE